MFIFIPPPQDEEKGRNDNYRHHFTPKNRKDVNGESIDISLSSMLDLIKAIPSEFNKWIKSVKEALYL